MIVSFINSFIRCIKSQRFYPNAALDLFECFARHRNLTPSKRSAGAMWRDRSDLRILFILLQLSINDQKDSNAVGKNIILNVNIFQ